MHRFVVDSSDPLTFPSASVELHALLAVPQLLGIPLLVLGNKNDVQDHATVDQIIDGLDLSSVKDREVFVYSCSAKNGRNMDLVLAW